MMASNRGHVNLDTSSGAGAGAYVTVNLFNGANNNTEPTTTTSEIWTTGPASSSVGFTVDQVRELQEFGEANIELRGFYRQFWRYLEDIAKGLEMDETIRDKDLIISERSGDANELELRNDELIKEMADLQIKFDEIDGEDLLGLKKKAKRLQTDRNALQREVSALTVLNKELDW